MRQGLNEQAENIDVWSVLLHQAVVAWLGSEKLKSPVDVSSRRAFHNTGTGTTCKQSREQAENVTRTKEMIRRWTTENRHALRRQ